MDEASSDTVRMAQMNQIYQALGRFVVQFSRMIDTMGFGLSFAIGGNQKLFFAVVAELSADPFARAWRSVMVESINLKEDDRKVLSGIYNEIVELIQLRNDWSHGTWFVGYGESADEWAKADLHRFKNSSSGFAQSSGLEGLPTAEYINAVAAHTTFVTEAIFDFQTNVRLLQEEKTEKRPSDRIRITKADGRRHFQMSSNGVDWRSSEMPPRSDSPS